MKIRNGFVSNSSSSSFVFRGIRIKKDKLNELIKYDDPKFLQLLNEDEFYLVDTVLKDKSIDLQVAATRYFFGGEKEDDILIGRSVETPEDGQVTEYKDDPVRDKSIKKELFKLGLKMSADERFSYFFQYISSDNY